MKIKDIEECLEIMWHLKENNESDLNSFIRHDTENFGKDSLSKLEKNGYITISNEIISMSLKGEETAKQVVRRHRLAERLLTNVLGMKPEDVESGACEFEHILAPEITESICILLGHPRLCPHGTKIPEGECCKKHEQHLESAVFPLTKAKIGEDLRVAYINTSLDSRLQKLFHFQILPGITVKICQKYPSFVVQSGNIKLAMDENITNEIYVWRNGHDK